MKAYHFVGETLRNGKPIPPDGEWLIHEGEVEMCRSGLHASRNVFDALQYAPGATLCIVECEDIVNEGVDKFVCRRRKIIKRIDATDLLWGVARKYALSVIHLWDAPAVVREYLETGNKSKRDAVHAIAWSNEIISKGDTDRANARAAAWYASKDATRYAAWEAVLDTARAAKQAVWYNANSAQKDMFVEQFAEIEQ